MTARAPTQYLSIDELRHRGWSARQVRDFLGRPDDMSVPKGNRPGRPHRLYRLDRVLQVERSLPEFAVSQARKAQASERARRRVQSKANLLLALVDAIYLPSLSQPYAQLLADAHSRMTALSSDESEQRVALSILLDRLKPMDAKLTIYARHSGICDARVRLKEKILAHIVKHYPALHDVADAALSNLRGEN